MRFICKKHEGEKVTPLLMTQAIMDCVIEEVDAENIPSFINAVRGHLMIASTSLEREDGYED